jgi:hypothetical protein
MTPSHNSSVATNIVFDGTWNDVDEAKMDTAVFMALLSQLQ